MGALGGPRNNGGGLRSGLHGCPERVGTVGRCGYGGLDTCDSVDLRAKERKIAWAFAKAGQRDDALFAALARAATPRLGEFTAQGLSNTAWAFAAAGQRDEALFAALAKAATPRLGEFNPQELANMAWAFATAP